MTEKITISLQERLIKYEQLIPCKAAFIDAKTPGSHLKDNYSIIGGGVSESTTQKVNLTLKHGFCIGAAGQPPKIKNSPHSHFTAEVFMIFSGTWCFYWNNDCEMQTTLSPGDIIALPTNMFRGFENVGNTDGMVFSILGHDDAGGGVVWLPRVIEEAQNHGLILLDNGKLVDTTIGEIVPEGRKPVSVLTSEELTKFNHYTQEEMEEQVGRKDSYKSSIYPHFPNKTPSALTYFDIIGPSNNIEHNFHVKPSDYNGDLFNVYGLHSQGNGDTGIYYRNEVEVMLIHRGNFEVCVEHDGEVLESKMKEGDIISFPIGSKRSIKSIGEGFAYLVVGGDYPQAPTKV